MSGPVEGADVCHSGRKDWRSRVYALAAGLAFCAMLQGCSSAPSAHSAAPPAAPHLQPQKDWSDAVIYFAMVDRFADGDPGNNAHVDRANPGGWHGGDLKGLAAQLDEIADLGATAVWITPLVRQVEFCPQAQGAEGGFEHCAFHGYWADDFTALDPHFGTEADLAALVHAAHARGIKVLLDVVYNHVGYGSHYLTDPATRGWIRTKEVDCEVDPLTCQVGGLPDLRTELPQVQDYLLNAHLGLAARVGLDGLRLDTVKHVEHAFWQRHRSETRARLGAGFFLLGEVWGGSAAGLDEYFAADELDAGFDFTFRGECRGFIQGKGRPVAYAAYLERRQAVRSGHYLAHYLSSHDEPLFLSELAGDKQALRLCVALQMTSAGIPVVFYGEEVARAGGAWPYNRNDMPWGSRNVQPGKGRPRDESLRDWYRQLIALRRAHPALRTGDFHRLYAQDDLLVFSREQTAAGDAVIVAINRGSAEAQAGVAVPGPWTGRTLKEVLSGLTIYIPADRLNIQVPPRSARIFVAP